jgi:signal peptidase I
MRLPWLRTLAILCGFPLTGLLVGLWFFLFRPIALGGPATFVIVAGTSMEPTYVTGDLAITQRRSAYAVGDVVAYETDSGIIIHRIVGGDAEHGFEVRGDNRDTPDLWHPKASQILGVAWLHVPGAGTVLAVIRQPAVFAGLFAGIAFFLAFTAGPLPKRRQPSPATGDGASGSAPAPGSAG